MGENLWVLTVYYRNQRKPKTWNIQAKNEQEAMTKAANKVAGERGFDDWDLEPVEPEAK